VGHPVFSNGISTEKTKLQYYIKYNTGAKAIHWGAVSSKEKFKNKCVLSGDTGTNDSKISVLNVILTVSRMQLLWCPNTLTLSIPN
jgi:hypothetical protein